MMCIFVVLFWPQTAVDGNLFTFDPIEIVEVKGDEGLFKCCDNGDKQGQVDNKNTLRRWSSKSMMVAVLNKSELRKKTRVSFLVLTSSLLDLC
jgi:hypothetical protein